MRDAFLADTVVMVRATHFRSNPETAASNAFQCSADEAGVAGRALVEQQAVALALADAGVTVLVLEPTSASPDGIFPNNWFTTHGDASVVLYPMAAPSRRTEVMDDIDVRLGQHGFQVRQLVDLRAAAGGRRLEGTGALVLDREHRTAYACRSSRCDPALAGEWADRSGYSLCLFNAVDPQGLPVYHTNVIMSLGAGMALLCLEAVPDRKERARLCGRLREDAIEIVELGWEQVCAFAGNQLFLQGRDGPVVALSASADACLDAAQKRAIDRHARRVAVDIATIERHGGGSVRCMLAEIFLPRQKNDATGAP